MARSYPRAATAGRLVPFKSRRSLHTALAEIGFAVAFGVLLDTIVVRSVLVTALNPDLGRWIWWPSSLAR